MIAVDHKGNELLDMIDVDESDAEKMYRPINHCLLVVKIANIRCDEQFIKHF